MSIIGSFVSPAMGMMSQVSAFGTISQNIVNLNTGGHKAVDTRFSTLLASNIGGQGDTGGVRVIRRNLISTQGRTLTTTNPLDVSINGSGMFVLQSKLTGGDTFYSRDGAFQVSTALKGSATVNGQNVTINQGYLVDKNGMFLQGFLPDSNGDFPTTGGTLSSLRVDRFAFSSDAAATTTAELSVILPAEATVGATHSASASVFDPTGATKSFEFTWTKLAANNQWTLSISPKNGTSSSTTTVTFDENGNLPSGTNLTVAINWDDSQTSSIVMDISNSIQLGNNFQYSNFQRNGRVPGDLERVSFDAKGHLVGSFSNGTVRNLYKLPLAVFPNPDGLIMEQGNLFSISTLSGVPVLAQAAPDGFGVFTPYSQELSNTNLANEFTKMIMAQQAYNSSASVFKTVDEMIRTAAGLKT